ncbi:MAG: iron-sulfur cluster repair di-iron protein [Prolixibacteraceae bacterium]|jgi:regulator of cell morphogenesis and NO signaling|nr:iron-sulfur cluster repair di-iron protein [Prolixibacteraceae bacterium]
MEKIKYGELSLGEIVVKDFRAASLFSKAGLDFCCGGKKTLNQACDEKSLNSEGLERELNELQNQPIGTTQDFNSWNLAFLADYIVNTHHQYVLKTLPELVFYTQKVATVHGSHHPELVEVAALFAQVNSELLQHLQKEEEVLFPAIKEALKDKTPEARETIASEIRRMSGEHEFAGGAIDQIAVLTQGYLVPDDACNTYLVTLKLLKQFEDDLHIHVHLENNILYPKALLLKSVMNTVVGN